MAMGGRWPRAAKHQTASNEAVAKGRRRRSPWRDDLRRRVAGLDGAWRGRGRGPRPRRRRAGAGRRRGRGRSRRRGCAGRSTAIGGGQAGETLGLVGSGVVVDAAGVVDGHALVGGAMGADPGVGIAREAAGRLDSRTSVTPARLRRIGLQRLDQRLDLSPAVRDRRVRVETDHPAAKPTGRRRPRPPVSRERPVPDPGLVARKTLTPTLSQGEREDERPELGGRGGLPRSQS